MDTYTKENRRRMLQSRSTVELFNFSTFKFCCIRIEAIRGFYNQFFALFFPVKTDVHGCLHALIQLVLPSIHIFCLT